MEIPIGDELLVGLAVIVATQLFKILTARYGERPSKGVVTAAIFVFSLFIRGLASLGSLECDWVDFGACAMLTLEQVSSAAGAAYLMYLAIFEKVFKRLGFAPPPRAVSAGTVPPVPTE